MRRLGVGSAHLGRERFKYVFQVRDIVACDLAGLDAHFVAVRVQWTRGVSRTTTQLATLTAEQRVSFVESPMLVCSMFRLRKSGVAFDPKPSQFKLVGVRSDESMCTIGTRVVDLSQLVNLEEAALNPSMLLDLPLVMRSGFAGVSASIRLTLTARLMKLFE
jgi:hypothetical protein